MAGLIDPPFCEVHIFDGGRATRCHQKQVSGSAGGGARVLHYANVVPAFAGIANDHTSVAITGQIASEAPSVVLEFSQAASKRADVVLVAPTGITIDDVGRRQCRL
jgi:hypothetical protein